MKALIVILLISLAFFAGCTGGRTSKTPEQGDLIWCTSMYEGGVVVNQYYSYKYPTYVGPNTYITQLDGTEVILQNCRLVTTRVKKNFSTLD